MTITLFRFADLFARHLDAAAHLLNKGVAHAEANGIAEAEMLGWRLAADMHPLSFQLMVVANFSQSWLARAAALPVPEPVTADLDVGGYRTAIAAARAWLAALTAEQFAGRDDVPLTVQITDTLSPTLPAGQWVSVFAQTNVGFHLSMVYAILRMKGVPLGKIDLFPAGL